MANTNSEPEKKVKIKLPIIPGMAKQEALFVGCNT